MSRTRTPPSIARPILALSLAILGMTTLALAGPRIALAQASVAAPDPQPRVGAKVRDSRGDVAGTIERVIAGPDGRPRQILVRVGRILRTLPVDGLTPSRGGFASVLSRAELDSLPPSE
jgi:hypothetical protein